MNALLLVMAGGALGAGARFMAGRAIGAVLGAQFPWGTLAINVIGGLFMGVLAGSLTRHNLGEGYRLFVGVGILGGFTTFSAFSLDAVMLAERGELLLAGGYVVASVIGAIAALVAGLALARGVA